MGTVICYIDENGAEKQVLVLDAKYRTITKFGTYGTKVFPNIQDYNIDNNYINGTSSSNTKTPVKDTTVNKAWKNLIDPHTSRYNCNVFMNYKNITDSQGIKGVPAIEHCRSISVSLEDNKTQSCDLPNQNIAIRIFIEGHNLDKCDPTLSRHKGYSLTNWNFYDGNISTRFICTSTEASNTGVRDLRYDGAFFNGNKAGRFLVTPILEL